MVDRTPLTRELRSAPPLPVDLPGWRHEAVISNDDWLPAGFYAVGGDAGRRGRVAAVWSIAANCTSAVTFTSNAIVGAPILLARGDCNLLRVRAFAVHAANANVGGGNAGLREERLFRDAAAEASGIVSQYVLTAGTGVVGEPFEATTPAQVISSLIRSEPANRADRFAKAITTTDRWQKCATTTVKAADGKSYRISAQAKGAGMIEPRFATLLCAIQTDAGLDAQTAQELLSKAVSASFDRVSVDGQLSTSDTCVLMANGRSGHDAGLDDARRRVFVEHLTGILRYLAFQIVRDGEGTERLAEVTVRGPVGDMEPIARAVARSPLIKAALHGGDPNFGRIMQAVGQAAGEHGIDISRLQVSLGGIKLASYGQITALTDADQAELAAHAAGAVWSIFVNLVEDPAAGTTSILFSDLSYEYVRINAEYTS